MCCITTPRRATLSLAFCIPPAPPREYTVLEWLLFLPAPPPRLVGKKTTCPPAAPPPASVGDRSLSRSILRVTNRSSKSGLLDSMKALLVLLMNIDLGASAKGGGAPFCRPSTLLPPSSIMLPWVVLNEEPSEEESCCFCGVLPFALVLPSIDLWARSFSRCWYKIDFMKSLNAYS